MCAERIDTRCEQIMTFICSLAKKGVKFYLEYNPSSCSNTIHLSFGSSNYTAILTADGREMFKYGTYVMDYAKWMADIKTRIAKFIPKERTRILVSKHSELRSELCYSTSKPKHAYGASYIFK